MTDKPLAVSGLGRFTRGPGDVRLKCRQEGRWHRHRVPVGGWAHVGPLGQTASCRKDVGSRPRAPGAHSQAGTDRVTEARPGPCGRGRSRRGPLGHFRRESFRPCDLPAGPAVTPLSRSTTCREPPPPGGDAAFVLIALLSARGRVCTRVLQVQQASPVPATPWVLSRGLGEEAGADRGAETRWAAGELGGRAGEAALTESPCRDSRGEALSPREPGHAGCLAPSWQPQRLFNELLRMARTRRRISAPGGPAVSPLPISAWCRRPAVQEKQFQNR